ncbi:MAG: deoxyribonuclease V [Nitrospiraceae bacterium]|nr:deoxyribonuclease V [Nitrospirota bacterium]MDA8338094.1 deoxyribonuclease V [Nitrospiraceae bacterium]
MIKNLWPKDIAEAKEIQDILRKQVKIMPLKKTPELIAGVDAAFAGDKIVAIAALYEYPGLKHIQDAFYIEKIRFPYIPGMLSFREGHAIVNALKKLKTKPDLILFDGQGIAHPKGIGIASHIGVILNIPTIGCAKSRLVGEFEEPDTTKGSRTYLYYKGMKVGAVLRTRSNVKPVFVSPGHMIDIDSSIEIVMKCVFKYRIPEPLRRADYLSKKLKPK